MKKAERCSPAECPIGKRTGILQSKQDTSLEILAGNALLSHWIRLFGNKGVKELFHSVVYWP